MAGKVVHHNGVSRLVDRRELPLVGRNHPALFLGACNDLDHGFLQILHTDEGTSQLCGTKGSFIQKILEIGAGEACGLLGDGIEIHVVGQRLIPGVYPKNGGTALGIRGTHIDLPVKAAGTQQSGVQNVYPVGSGHDDHALAALKAVHFHQQLVQGLLPLIVTAAKTGATLTAYRINLIDENDGRSLLFGLLKQVTDTACANAHIELYKIRTGD